jgi:hypothetical protein
MPYKDPLKKKEHDRLRAERARIRRAHDPAFAKKESDARKRWYAQTYKIDPEYRRMKNAKRVPMKYGLSLEEYHGLLAAQDYKCLICGLAHRDETGGRLVIDHDHQQDVTAVRGLLCGACNLALGLFKDNPASLRAAANYLEQRQ